MPVRTRKRSAAWEGAGPYTITDNYLAASGENILFGGGDNLGGEATNPADILVAGNYIHKPQAWRDFHRVGEKPVGTEERDARHRFGTTA